MDIRQSVARLVSEDKKHWGTAFFVGSGNLLLTCFHVALETRDSKGQVAVEVLPPEVLGVAPPPVRLSARVLPDDCSAANEWDIALLELIGPVPEWVKPLRISGAIDAYRGQQIDSFGFCDVRPEYGDPAMGIVVGLATDPSSSRQVIEIMSKQLTGGFSGAPIVDGERQVVVGMMMSTLRQDARKQFANHCWAVPASAFAEVSTRIPLIEHPLISELLRLAMVRYPSLLDYAVLTGSGRVTMPARLQQVQADGAVQPLDVEQMLELIADASCKVATLSGVSGSGKSTFLRTILGKGLADGVWAPGQKKLIPLYLAASSLAVGSAGTAFEQLSQAMACDKSFRYRQSLLVPDLIRLIGQSRTRFIVLVDGLDEISNPVLRAETAQSLAELGQQLSAQKHWLIVASRPIEELKQFGSNAFPVLNFEMCNSTEEDTAWFFSQVLADRAPAFVEQYKGIAAADLQGSPLLAALAVSLFLEQGHLPGTIVEIFSVYVQLLISRANGYAAVGSLEAEVLEEWQGILERLAYQSLLVDGLTWDKALKTLQRALPQSGSAVSRVVATAQLDSVTQSPLVLIREDNLLRWTHLSIRDYLAGRFIDQGSLSTQAWDASLGAWREPTFRGAVTFAILSRSADRPLDHQALSAILSLNGTDSDFDTVSFLCRLVELQAPMESELLLDIIDFAVFFGLEKIDRFASCQFVFSSYTHPFDHLLPLIRQHPVVAGRIREIIDLPSVSTAVKRVLAKKLLNL
jgi:hypothetical protein